MNKQQLKSFKANGKVYPHYRRHQANSRQVDLDIFKASFEKRKNRQMTKDEFQVFRTAYGMAYKEGLKRGKNG